MKEKPEVNYLDAVERFSRELYPSRDKQVVLPEHAGKLVVDYTVVSEK